MTVEHRHRYRASEALALDLALQSLAELDLRKSQVVELRFFGGLSVEETADALGISPETVHRDWRFTKSCAPTTWNEELQHESGGPTGGFWHAPSS